MNIHNVIAVIYIGYDFLLLKSLENNVKSFDLFNMTLLVYKLKI